MVQETFLMKKQNKVRNAWYNYTHNIKTSTDKWRDHTKVLTEIQFGIGGLVGEVIIHPEVFLKNLT